jgi:hypothetical protein
MCDWGKGWVGIAGGVVCSQLCRCGRGRGEVWLHVVCSRVGGCGPCELSGRVWLGFVFPVGATVGSRDVLWVGRLFRGVYI